MRLSNNTFPLSLSHLINVMLKLKRNSPDISLESRVRPSGGRGRTRLRRSLLHITSVHRRNIKRTIWNLARIRIPYKHDVERHLWEPPILISVPSISLRSCSACVCGCLILLFLRNSPHLLPQPAVPPRPPSASQSRNKLCWTPRPRSSDNALLLIKICFP